jgi:tetratricopeptide (TPR) repeat protein
LLNLIKTLACCASPQADDSPESGPSTTLAGKTAQAAAPGAHRAPFMQPWVHRLQSIAAVLSCGLYRRPMQYQDLHGVSDAARAELARCIQKLSKNRGDLGAQRRLAAAHCQIGGEYRDRDHPHAALVHYQQAIALGTRLMPKVNGDHEFRAQLLQSSHTEVCKLQQTMGNLKAALASGQAALKISQQFVKTHGDSFGWSVAIADNHLHLGEVQLSMGKRADALQSAQRALALLVALQKKDPNPRLELDIDRVSAVVGDLKPATGAQTAARAELERCSERVSQDPNNQPAQYRLAQAHHELGLEQHNRHDPQAALASYQNGIRILTQVMSTGVYANPYLEEPRRRLLWRSHVQVGDLQLKMGLLPAALASAQAALVISQELVEVHGGKYDGDQAFSHLNLGDLQRRMGKRSDALQNFQSALELLTPLAKNAPDNAHLKRELAETHIAVGDLQYCLGDEAAALQHYQQARDILIQQAAAPGSKVSQFTLEELAGKIKDLQGVLPQGE